jgi:hypothetical protein
MTPCKAIPATGYITSDGMLFPSEPIVVITATDFEHLAQLHEAIARSGMDISPCRVCSKPVVCVPDGLTFCEACAELEAATS